MSYKLRYVAKAQRGSFIARTSAPTNFIVNFIVRCC